MRIVLVINSLGPGGAEWVLSQLANYWCAKGHEVSLLTFDSADVRPFHEIREGVTRESLSITLSGRGSFAAKLLSVPGLCLKLRRRILGLAPDMVVSFIDQTNMFVLFSLLGSGIPVVVSERIFPGKNPFYDIFPAGFPRSLVIRLQGILYRRARKVVVQTEAGAQALAAQGFSGRNLVSIPNPVSPPPAELLTELQSREFLVVGMGRLVAQKRFDLLIDAFALIAAGHPEWRLEIFGEGPLRRELQARIDERGMQQRISLSGIRRAPYEVFARAQIFVLSSDYEGFPNVLCQAMACGCAVISTDCDSGPREIIREGVDGFLVATGESAQIAERLSHLMTSSDLRAALGDRARELPARFDAREIFSRWDSLLDSEPAR